MPTLPLTPAWAQLGPFFAAGAGPGPKQNITYLEMCSFTCFHYVSWNFANTASSGEMTITTRTVLNFCTKRRAVQPPIFLLDQISWVTNGVREPWPECQPNEPWRKCHHPSAICVLFAYNLFNIRLQFAEKNMPWLGNSHCPNWHISIYTGKHISTRQSTDTNPHAPKHNKHVHKNTLKKCSLQHSAKELQTMS